jgi:sugar phosphate isomerase/epimerase
MNILLDGAPDIDWEMDVAWVMRAEQDPMEWAEKYGSRITALHVKDLAPKGEAQDEDGWADVGHGTMNWRALLPRLKSNTAAAHLVMEHDNPSDLERFVSRSIQSVTGL